MPGCSNADAVPATVQQRAVGRVTPDASALLVAQGGQACYIGLKNNTIHATPLTLRYYTEGPAGQSDLCSSTFAMKAGFGSELVFVNTMFGADITWRVEVSVATDVDVADVLCTMYA